MDWRFYTSLALICGAAFCLGMFIVLTVVRGIDAEQRWYDQCAKTYTRADCTVLRHYGKD